MHLADTSVAVLAHMGLTDLKDAADAVRVLHLPTWIVRRVAYAADVQIEEAGAFVGEVAALPRKRRTQVHVWGRPGRSAHAAQWDASGVRVQFYRKDLQLERRLKNLRTNDDALGRDPRTGLTRVAERARNTVRLEVTLGNLRAIRTALSLDAPSAPTFRLMALRETGDYIFGRELSRLRLLGVRDDAVHDPDVGQGDPAMPERLREESARMRSLYERFLVALRSDNQSEAARASPISPTRLRNLFATYLLKGAYTHEELLGRCGYATSTLSKDLRELDRLGLPPTGTPSSEIQSWLEVYMGRLRAVMPGIRTELGELPKSPDGLVRDVPWADDDDPTDDAGELDVTSSDFQDLLNEVVNGLDEAQGGVAPAVGIEASDELTSQA